MQIIINFIMRGRYQAILAASITAILSQIFLMLSVVSLSIIGLVVLRKGSQEGIVVSSMMVMAVASTLFFVENRPGLDYPVVLILLIPVFVGANILRNLESQGLMVSVLAGFAALFAIAIQLISGDAILWWSDWLKIAVLGVKGASFQDFEKSGSLEVMNGLIASFLLILAIVSVFLARWLQALSVNVSGFKIEFSLLQIPRSLFIKICFSLAIITLLHRPLMQDLAIIVMGMYFFQGLAILHYNVLKKERQLMILLPPYFLLFLIPHYVIAGFACVGISDIFLNYRNLGK